MPPELVQVVKDRPALQPPRLYHRQHPFHKRHPASLWQPKAFFRHSTPRAAPAPRGCWSARLPRSPRTATPPATTPTRWRRSPPCCQRTRRPALRAPPIGPGRPAVFATPVGRRRPRGTGATPRTLARRPAATFSPAAPPPRHGRPASGSPSSGGPAHWPEGRQPVVGAPAVAADQAPDLLPQQRCQSVPAAVGVDQGGGHGFVAATHSQHNVPANFQLVSSTFLTAAARTTWRASAWAGAKASLTSEHRFATVPSEMARRRRLR